MVDRIVNKVTKQRLELWNAFKGTLKIKGYEYYQPPPEIKYRYPAPGSQALDEVDKFNMYKQDWKKPFRTSQFNIQKIDLAYYDDDPREAENLVSRVPQLDENHKFSGKYDAALNQESHPVFEDNQAVMDSLTEKQKED